MSPAIDSELRARLSASEALIPTVAIDLANPSWEESAARILVLRLSSLREIEGSTSHLVLFAECRRALPLAYIDFAFYPERRDRELLGEGGLPFFYGLESGRSAADFDLILVSNAFALELVNLSRLFAGSQLPRRASARRALASADPAARVPIVILGGSNAPATGCLLFPGEGPEEGWDCLVDGIFFGEGESEASGRGGIGELARVLSARGRSRAERLEAAAAVDGFWRALSGERATRRILRPRPPTLLKYPLLNTPGADTARLQISAGCEGFCSFCLEGWASRPYREFPLAELTKAARELKAATGASVLEVYSFNFNTHAEVFALIFELNRVFARVNFMSQRLDLLAESRLLASAELAAGKRSFTLGIEGLSQRLRRYYRKGIDGDQIEAAIDRLALPAVRELKLFYILSGFEDEADVAEFAEFAHSCAERRRRSAPGQRIIVSAGYLARLPFTPLQYAPLCLDRDRLEAIAGRVELACSAAGLEFRLASKFEDYYVDQLLSLGGASLAPWLERTVEAGVFFEGGLARGGAVSLEAAALEAGLLGPEFLGEKGEDWRQSLAFIDENGPALRRVYELASSFAPEARRLGVPESPGAEWLGRLERLMASKKKFPSILIRLDLPRSLARARPEYRSAWILRSIAAAEREGGGAVYEAEEALFGKGCPLEGMADRYWGLAFCRLRGPSAAAMAEAATAAGFGVVEALPGCQRIVAEIELPSNTGRAGEEALCAWLAEERIGYLETRRAGPGGTRVRVFEARARDLKKKAFFEAELQSSSAGAGFKARLSLGPKGAISAWLARLDRPGRDSSSVKIVSYD